MAIAHKAALASLAVAVVLLALWNWNLNSKIDNHSHPADHGSLPSADPVPPATTSLPVTTTETTQPPQNTAATTFAAPTGTDAEGSPASEPQNTVATTFAVPPSRSYAAWCQNNTNESFCAPPPATPEQFWEYAFNYWNINGEARQHRWIGGLVSSYNTPEWFGSPEDEAPLLSPAAQEAYQGEAGDTYYETWIDDDWRSYSGFFYELSLGERQIPICYEHNCEKQGNLIGSTNPTHGCRAYVWDTEYGIWLLMKIDETQNICTQAYARVLAQEITAFSASTVGHISDTGRTKPGNSGEERRVLLIEGGAIREISLAETGRDMDAWAAAIDFR